MVRKKHEVDVTGAWVARTHCGRIGGGQKGIGAELFWSRFRGGVQMREPDRDELSRVVVVGKVGAPEFAQRGGVRSRDRAHQGGRMTSQTDRLGMLAAVHLLRALGTTWGFST